MQYLLRERNHWPDHKNVGKCSADAYQPVSQFFGDNRPKKNVPVSMPSPFTQHEPSLAIKNFRGLSIASHLRLVPVAALSDNPDMVSIATLLRPAVDFVLPERCPSCGTITPAGGTFCSDCWQQMRFLSPPWCSACMVPFAFEQTDETRCASCLANPPSHEGIRAVVAYDDVSRQVVLKLKYGAKIGMAK